MAAGGVVKILILYFYLSAGVLTNSQDIQKACAGADAPAVVSETSITTYPYAPETLQQCCDREWNIFNYRVSCRDPKNSERLDGYDWGCPMVGPEPIVTVKKMRCASAPTYHLEESK